MSLAAPYQEHYYVADGVTTSFAFGEDFTALSAANVKCIVYFEDGTNCVPTFTVDMTTGFITIVTLTKPDGTVLTVPPAGSIVRVFRDTPEQQNVTASQLQNYTAKQLERIFDSVVAMIQEVSYSDLHKTIRLTETQRDVSMEQLKEENDQAILYWDFETRQLKATDYGQNQVVKSDTVDRLVYLQPEGKIYFIPKGSNNPIAIGSATIHNDLGGRNAPDCHPESAITGLREHLQELRDKDIEIEEDVQIALNRSQEAKDTADEAKETAEYAQTIAEEAKDIAEDAKETAEGIDEKAQTALDNSEEALDKVTQEITDRQDADDALQDQITDNKGAIEDHIADTSNPHQVTKTQVGLGNVDNTSDLDKPISTATQSALDLKMPISTKYGASLSLTIDSSTYVVTAQLKDQDNNNLGTAQTIDLPLESVVVSGSYDSDTKEVILVLENGSEIRFSVADLISGLQSEITAQNPLDADLVNDSTSAHKFVTATEKTNWNNHIANTNNPHQVTKAQVGLGNVDNTSDLNKPISTATQTALDLKADKSTTYTKTETDTLLGAKQDTISDLATIRSGAALGATAVQPGDNVSELVNDAGYLTQHQTLADLGITATASEINVLDGITASTTELNYTDGVTSNIQTQLNSKQATISDLATIRSNAQAGKVASDTIATYGDIVTHDVSEFATSAQGAKADTAVQPSDLATVATTGSYNDLSDKPTIGNATLIIQKNSTTIDTFTANATSNKTIDIAVPTKTSDITNDSDYQNGTQVATAISTHNTSATAHSNQFNAITDKIPAEASSSNKLADKAFVNSSIATNTANFIGTFNSVAELEAYSGTVTNNDYAFVIVTDSAGNTAYDRYKYTTATTPASWVFEYELNNSSFTATQWAAINSGANTTNIGQIATNTTTISNHIGNTSNPHQVTKAQVGLGNVDNTSDLDKPISTATQTALNAKANTADLATVATSGSYNDLSDKPTIPTVNNATLTIQKNGTTVQTFTANQSTNATANISVPTKTSDITNDSGFITSSALAPYALSADLATVATTGDYDDLSNKPTIPTVGNGTITITQGGISKGTFTTNQSGNTTIALDAGGGGSVDIDNLTITENASNEIQAVGVVNQNIPKQTSRGKAVKTWTGILSEYNSQTVSVYAWKSSILSSPLFSLSENPRYGDELYYHTVLWDGGIYTVVSVSGTTLTFQNSNGNTFTATRQTADDTTMPIKSTNWLCFVSNYGVYKGEDNPIAKYIQIDSTPTSGSSNAVSSGGVYTALSNKASIDLDNLTSTGKSKLGPTVYDVRGQILNGSGDPVAGVGEANVYLYPNGRAVIKFFVKITTSGSSTSNFTWGINRDLLSALNSNIPTITPSQGVCTYYTTGGNISTAKQGYAGRASASGQFWLPGRVYTTSGSVGGWPPSEFAVDQMFEGLLYGTYTV